MPDDDNIDFSMFLDDYLSDAKEGIQAMNRALLVLEKDRSQAQEIDEVLRALHTLKSSSTMLDFADITELAHLCEDLLARLRDKEVPITQETIDVLFSAVDTLDAMVRGRGQGESGAVDSQAVAGRVRSMVEAKDRPVKKEGRKASPASTPVIDRIRTIRVNVELLDSLFDLAGELIITKNRIDTIIGDTAGKELRTALAETGRMISELQENVSAARLVPVGEIFEKFPRMVRDLAKDVHKTIDLVIEGREIELDKAVLDAISEPLIHLLRNAVDHGIEPPDERETHKKQRRGTIRLAATRTENHILIHVEDDGCGIEVARIKNIAVSRGVLAPQEAESLADKDVLKLLFAPGFTSAEEVTGLSGRGVGLDVVKTATERLGGTVEVATQKGNGTLFTLTLPLATAIMQTLMVGIGEHVFAIPSDVVLETLKVERDMLRDVRDDQMLVLRGNVVPFTYLDDALSLGCTRDPDNLLAVIIRRAGQLMALGVDEVLDQMENIVKPFDPIAQQFRGFSGGTILGDGRVALLLDIQKLLGFETLREERYTA